MGYDKDATDIWLFGRKRPDLSPEETMAEFCKRHEAASPRVEREEDIMAAIRNIGR